MPSETPQAEARREDEHEDDIVEAAVHVRRTDLEHPQVQEDAAREDAQVARTMKGR